MKPHPVWGAGGGGGRRACLGTGRGLSGEGGRQGGTGGGEGGERGAFAWMRTRVEGGRVLEERVGNMETEDHNEAGEWDGQRLSNPLTCLSVESLNPFVYQIP